VIREFCDSGVLASSQKVISKHIKINVFMWIINSIFSTVYSGHFLFYFRGEGNSFYEIIKGGQKAHEKCLYK
jgi:hypothetical protein